MTENVFDLLERRGYIDQVTFPEELKERLAEGPITFYIGFDATADSLTLGHYLQVKVLQHFQRAGHIPITLFGGGTTLIGDPSGRSDMRKLLTKENIDHNIRCFQEQLSHFIDYGDGKAIAEDNGDWLLDLKYLDFMREIGIHFSVNHMLKLDAYANRLEEGLTFFEMGYMLMQSYDFLYFYRKHNCQLQLGGSDQWSNMLGGYDLVRKLENGKVYSMTFKLLTTADGQKMGKSMKGAIFLDPEKTSPYEMFQYLRNCDDRDVIKFLKLLTDVSDAEIAEYEKLEGQALNEAKERLAWEITNEVHGKEEADKALASSRTLFGGSGDTDEMPTTELSAGEVEGGITVVELMQKGELISSMSEGRRLIKQGGVSVDDEKVASHDQLITPEALREGVRLRKGKKVHHLFTLKEE
ncbi:Tyrosine--tRNA ligase [Aedoeadaptatus ivorii]|uniref:Tyrosine--tRNA ligase n=1 Tax=Aedoeadaptatus ivorii TaxID=54006 RepID=A0A3S5F7W8_9FIRM|nr:tyrosine--tRNA ligase [Peptoniphilus ivorii]MDQ0508131.1 tyrosyl-tRNA synthetase [Peptoniphilus ivorii]VEJ35862.1 Tyrosine--tRNA ligase [Peptoniphilus ivorii]